MNTPERQSPTERIDIQQKTEAIRSGTRPVDRDYPYIPPDYRVPFLHIGSDRQLFLDNFVLDHLDGVSREICAPSKTAEPLLSWSDLPWEQVQFNPGTAGVVHDPDDGLFKMWYWQGLTGHAFNEGQVLCYAESKDALRWEKPLRDDCLSFEGHKATNIVHPDVSQSGLALNHDRSDPDRKYLLVNWPPKAARVRPPNSPRLSRVDASPTESAGIRSTRRVHFLITTSRRYSGTRASGAGSASASTPITRTFSTASVRLAARRAPTSSTGRPKRSRSPPTGTPTCRPTLRCTTCRHARSAASISA